MSALTSEFTRSFFPAVLARAAQVHSFEPSPDNFRRLSAATRDLQNVLLTQAVVGERSGECKLYVSDKLNVDHKRTRLMEIHVAPFQSKWSRLTITSSPVSALI